ncbi:MAG: sulfatase-like hydrolase/transferase [Halobacteriaceae archaeon]
MPASDPDAVENVVLILTDQQRPDSLGCYGNEWVATPTLDRLAAAGTRFDRAYTPTALCSPARASLLTGVRPHRHGLTRNVSGDVDLAARWPCYPQRLREAGYRVGLSGKLHVGQDPRRVGFHGPSHEGYFYSPDHPDYEAYLAERDLPSMTVDRLRDAFPAGGARFQSGAVDDRPPEAAVTRYVADRAIEQIDAAVDAGDPFYQSVHFFGPHNPYYLPEEYLRLYDPADVEIPASAIKETFADKPWVHRAQARMSGLHDLPVEAWRRLIAAYHGWVTFIDDQVGRILDALADRGVTDSTAVVFTSDHGAFLTRHKLHDKGPAMYEDVYRVPLLAAGLGLDESDDRFVSLLDLPPTVLDLAGVDIPSAYDGQSLLDAGDWRRAITGEFHGHFFGYEQRMLRTDRYKLVVNAYDTDECYDLEADPDELTNLVGDPAHGAEVAALYDELRDRLAARGDDFFAGPTGPGERWKLSTTTSAGLDPYDP